MNYIFVYFHFAPFDLENRTLDAKFLYNTSILTQKHEGKNQGPIL